MTEYAAAKAFSPWRHLRESPDFRRFFSARTASFAGSSVTFVVLPVLVYGLTRSPLLTGLLSVTEALPYLLLGLLAGALADRWDRRRVMVTSDVICAALTASVPVAHLFGILTVGQLFAVALGVPAVNVLFDGAAFGALPAIVGRHRIAASNAAVWSASSLVEIAGPALAGAALAVVDGASLMALDALSFAASAMLLRGIRHALSTRDTAPTTLSVRIIRADIGEGVRWLWRHSGVRTMTLVGAAQSFSGGAFVALVVVWADRALDVRAGNWRLGIIYASWGAGGLVAVLALPYVLRRLSAAAVALVALPFSAVLGVLSALAPTWQLGAAGWLAWGVAYTMVVTNGVSYRQEVTPDALMSRVNTSGRMIAWGLGYPIGALVGGVLAAVLDIRLTLVLCTIPLVAAAVAAWCSPLRTDAWSGRDATVDGS